MNLTLSSTPLVSFLISTHNRRDVLLATLEQIERCGLSPDEYEIIVVDNASTDGTAAAISARFGSVRLIHSRRNLGACAKNLGLAEACGQYIVFLDDDSYPTPGSIGRMIEHFEADPRLGAAVFTVNLSDGSQECSAYPEVFIGCGTGFRHRALQIAGGLPTDFFMQAEEYHVSLRLLDAGWDIRRFDDLHVTHLKSPTARRSSRTTRLDVRNNITLAMRLFPPQWALHYAVEWTRRYKLIAQRKGHIWAYWFGWAQGIGRALQLWKRRPIDDWTFETFARIEQTEQRLRRAREVHGFNSVLLVDYGKNLFAWWLACQKLGLKVVAIADNNLGGSAVRFHGIPVIPDEQARRLPFDAAIISNLSPVHARLRAADWGNMTRPVIDLFADDRYADEATVEAFPYATPAQRAARSA